MNRQDAIQTLSEHLAHWERLRTENIAPMPEGERTIKALKMAIEALQREEAEANGYCHRIKPKEDFKIDDIPQDWTPTILGNVEVVVRCKDCRYRELDGEITHFYWCRINERPVDDGDFCAWAERREDGEA